MVFDVLVTYALVLVVLVCGASAGSHGDDLAEAGPLDIVVIGPILENLVLAFVAELMITFRARVGMIVLAIAVLSGAVHALHGWRAIAGFVGFAVYARSYLLWYDLGFGKRFAIIVAQHALANAPATLALVWFRALS